MTGASPPRSNSPQDADWLLVDIGNTRLKWAVMQAPASGAAPSGLSAVDFAAQLDAHAVASDAWSREDADGLMTAWRNALTAASAMGRRLVMCAARVGPVEWESLLQRFTVDQGIDLYWVCASASHGRLRNAYAEPASLGVDRFLSALAVAHTFLDEAAVIVSVGTATTVDALDAQGCFLGGYILPGPDLMAASLHRNTALLPQAGPVWADIPVTTEQAIASGIRAAQIGSVQSMLGRLTEIFRQPPRLIIAGGARSWLVDVWPDAVTCDNLVLQGLCIWMQTAPEPTGFD